MEKKRTFLALDIFQRSHLQGKQSENGWPRRAQKGKGKIPVPAQWGCPFSSKLQGGALVKRLLLACRGQLSSSNQFLLSWPEPLERSALC